MAIFIVNKIYVQKVKDKEKIKKIIRTENVGTCKHWEALFIKVIHHYFAAALPVAHAPARGWKAWIQTASTASNLCDGKKGKKNKKREKNLL